MVKEYFNKSFKYIFDEIEQGSIECNLNYYYNKFLRYVELNKVENTIEGIDKFIELWFFTPIDPNKLPLFPRGKNDNKPTEKELDNLIDFFTGNRSIV